MTVSAAKPEEKRLGWFVPTAVDQAESCVKPAAEGRNLARMPNPQHSETERLDHGPNWLKHTEDGLLLGECRLRPRKGNSAISHRGHGAGASQRDSHVLTFRQEQQGRVWDHDSGLARHVRHIGQSG
jgi:hypothetical protein